MRAGLLLGTWLLLAGCTEQDASTDDQVTRLETRAQKLAGWLKEIADRSAADELVVQLLFDDSVDLDLYVTDPNLETVYFASRESRSGGKMEGDVRCGDEAPRVETVRFPVPLPGRYRVGVDYPRSCGAGEQAAAFAVLARQAGRDLETRGVVTLQRFEVIVMEFDVD